jgi:hypothetical protein
MGNPINLPPPPILDPITDVDEKTLRSKGKSPVFITSLMWMDWLNRIRGMFTSGDSDHDSESVAVMMREDGGSLESIRKDVRDNKIEEIMRRDEYGDVEDARKEVRSLDVRETMDRSDYGSVEDMRGDIHDIEERLAMLSVSLDEIEKVKHDMGVMIIMGGSP